MLRVQIYSSAYGIFFVEFEGNFTVPSILLNFRLQISENVWQHLLGMSGLAQDALQMMILKLWLLCAKKKLDRKLV